MPVPAYPPKVEVENLPAGMKAAEYCAAGLKAILQACPAIRGGSIVDADATKSTAWMVTTGRPDVEIAVLDSGIRWEDRGTMNDVRFKVHLNKGELPVPNHAAPTPLVPGTDCSTYKNQYDANGDGVFNLRDYACDSRIPAATSNGVLVLTDPRRA